MNLLPLTNRPGLYALVDELDFVRLKDRRWMAHETKRGYVYATSCKNGKREALHRVLFGEQGLVVDHINGNTLDNRRCNLRSVSIAINAQNRTGPVKSVTGERHINKHPRGYVVRIVRFGKVHYGGCFESVVAAIPARNALAQQLAEAA